MQIFSSPTKNASIFSCLLVCLAIGRNRNEIIKMAFLFFSSAAIVKQKQCKCIHTHVSVNMFLRTRQYAFVCVRKPTVKVMFPKTRGEMWLYEARIFYYIGFPIKGTGGGRGRNSI